MRLLPRPVFPGLDKDAHQASGHRSANVGFRIIANHRHLTGGALETFDGEREECPRRLSEHGCLSAGSLFQGRNKGARVEAHFAVAIEKAAILRQCEKRSPVKNPPIGLVGGQWGLRLNSQVLRKAACVSLRVKFDHVGLTPRGRIIRSSSNLCIEV